MGGSPLGAGLDLDSTAFERYDWQEDRVKGYIPTECGVQMRDQTH